MLECAGEESAGGRYVPLLRDQHVDDLSELVDRPIQVAPLPGDLDVGLVGEPAISRDVSAWPGGVDKQGREPLHPAIDGHVIYLDTAFGEQLFHISVRESIAQVPTHRHHDHLRREPETREPGLRRTYSTGATMHPPTLPEHVIRQRNRP